LLPSFFNLYHHNQLFWLQTTPSHSSLSSCLTSLKCVNVCRVLSLSPLTKFLGTRIFYKLVGITRHIFSIKDTNLSNSESEKIPDIWIPVIQNFLIKLWPFSAFPIHFSIPPSKGPLKISSNFLNFKILNFPKLFKLWELSFKTLFPSGTLVA